MDCESCGHRRAGKSLFSCLGSADLETLELRRSTRSFSAGQVLYLAGDDAFGIYCLRRGLVKLEAFSAEGKVQLFRLARPGEPLGYRAYLSAGAQKYRATAASDVEVCALPKEVLDQFRLQNLQFGQSLMAKLATDLEEAEERWMGLVQKSAHQRVAEILLDFHSLGEKWPPRKEMAQLVDLTPETFARALSHFEKRGWLQRSRKKMELLRIEELRELSKAPC